jgi:site-specific recombinase XerD
MDSNDMILKFLDEKKEDEFQDTTKVTYQRKLKIFYESLKLNEEVTEKKIIDSLESMNENVLLRSIEHYIKMYNIRFEVTVDCYFAVIKSFYEHLYKNDIIKINFFDSDKAVGQLKKEIEKKYKEYKLSKKKEKAPITDEVFFKLCESCNEKISSYSPENNNAKYNPSLSSFISAIVIKLIMLTGLKNKIISKIQLKDFNQQLNKIKINGFWIHLPDKLAIQMEKYILVRKNLVSDKNEEYALFIDTNGNKIGTQYGLMFKILKDITGTTNGESISKYTIMKMIDVKIEPMVIVKFTGISMDTYNYCYEMNNENNDIKIINSELDLKIRSLDIWEQL